MGWFLRQWSVHLARSVATPSAAEHGHQSGRQRFKGPLAKLFEVNAKNKNAAILLPGRRAGYQTISIRRGETPKGSLQSDTKLSNPQQLSKRVCVLLIMWQPQITTN